MKCHASRKTKVSEKQYYDDDGNKESKESSDNSSYTNIE